MTTSQQLKDIHPANGLALSLLALQFGLPRRWCEPDWMLKRRVRAVMYMNTYAHEAAFGYRLPWRRRLLRKVVAMALAMPLTLNWESAWF